MQWPITSTWRRFPTTWDFGRAARALDTMNKLHAEFAGEGGDMLSSIIVKL